MSVLQEAMFISGYSFISINQRSAGLIITISAEHLLTKNRPTIYLGLSSYFSSILYVLML